MREDEARGSGEEPLFGMDGAEQAAFVVPSPARGRRREARSGADEVDAVGGLNPGVDAGATPPPSVPNGASSQPAASPVPATPMMAQYVELKAANADSLLFYRMGDFYELFFEDAEIASRCLGIVLTRRGKHEGQDVPMCGVPVVRADEYLQRLIAAGHRVAVCEQLEDPAEARKRGAKSVVRRDVVRLVTPGTLVEDGLLDPVRASRLLAIAPVAGAGGTTYGLAALDMASGSFEVREAEEGALAAEIARVDPAEIVAPEALSARLGDRSHAWGSASTASVTPLPDVPSDATAARRLAEFYGVLTLDGFGPLTAAETRAAALAVDAVLRTQRGARPALDAPKRSAGGASVLIDAATRANLELLRTPSGDRAGSLLGTIDRTVTSAGARLLCERLGAPSTVLEIVRARHEAVDALVKDRGLRAELRRRLKALPDAARALGRLSLDRGGPRDLAACRDVVLGASALAQVLSRTPARGAGELAEAVEELRLCAMPELRELAATLEALGEELPLLPRDGGFLRAGALASLDEARALRDESRRVIATLQAAHAERAGAKSLKIRHNGVLGYFVEVNAKDGERLLADAPWLRHRQTLAGVMRFASEELSDLEGRIEAAAADALALELDWFARAREVVVARAGAIRRVAAALATLDVAAALAEVADAERWCRPRVDDSLAFRASGLRHAVVEAALRRSGGRFVGNDLDLSPPEGAREGAGRLALVTGPNMAGKSTFLRQAALLAVLAQAGSFVPAKSAEIGMIDRLFSRVGAADDLARGRSTFMVEMVEAAAILNGATPRSLVILDEIGRGTATFDGLSIAWATVEHLHDANRCRALFATHFGELTRLADKLPRLEPLTMRVKEWKGEVVFLHEVAPGAADRSYGVHVARLAGLPPAVIARARDVLRMLEADERASRAGRGGDLPLFAATSEPSAQPSPEPAAPLLAALAELEPDALSPREAHEALYRLKALLDFA